MQWVVHKGLKVRIVSRGATGPARGAPPLAITERVSPGSSGRRTARPTERERRVSSTSSATSPSAGGGGDRHLRSQLVQTRAGVERIAGFCSEEASDKFPAGTPMVEKALVDSGHHSAEVLAGGDPNKSRSGGCVIASTMAARSGSSPPWTSSPSIAGMTTAPGRGRHVHRH